MTVHSQAFLISSSAPWQSLYRLMNYRQHRDYNVHLYNQGQSLSPAWMTQTPLCTCLIRHRHYQDYNEPLHQGQSLRLAWMTQSPLYICLNSHRQNTEITMSLCIIRVNPYRLLVRLNRLFMLAWFAHSTILIVIDGWFSIEGSGSL